MKLIKGSLIAGEPKRCTQKNCIDAILQTIIKIIRYECYELPQNFKQIAFNFLIDANSFEKRISWLNEYIDLYIYSKMPSLLKRVIVFNGG